MIEQLPESAEAILGLKLTGQLHDADYQNFVPAVDAAIAKHGTVRLLAHFHDFHGWDLHALWDDPRFSASHLTKIDPIALVGEKKWEEWMAEICKPFTMAKTQYFDAENIAAAWNWIREA